VTGATRWATLAVVLAGVVFASAQPQPMTARGCCCVVAGVAYRCAEKTQADCLALQPGAPVFPKLDDWRKAWNAYVAASEAQASKPSQGGWIAGSCGADINPATGEPRGAPTGCCCMPKLHLTGDDRFDCKPGATHFDCKAGCALLKDGRLPSGCTWKEGGCRQ
jgi:hypothetical protein